LPRRLSLFRYDARPAPLCWREGAIRARLRRGESRLQVIRFGQQRRQRRLQASIMVRSPSSAPP
jgi:hypothetical protein